ncbi:hypothetical protein GAO09_19480 [Rhizobiales bacterium RZME27]|uniref:Uncharacterized protein n=1 Tax=Endobacterium cereale TaxID=2663029 RepID=A0A6A8ABT7_9HYPH|nr:hypothetical protein [Endobacterium cereale]MQY48219.1 hypothetical protein [Endobacterium cereale]
MSIFRVGQKVVLVDVSSRDGGETRKQWEMAGAIYPDQNAVYTVRGIVYHSITGVEMIHLQEIDNTPICKVLNLMLEPAFESYRFRPVVDRKTDISIFKSLLTPSKQPVSA